MKGIFNLLDRYIHTSLHACIHTYNFVLMEDIIAQCIIQHEGLYKLSVLFDQFKDGLRRANMEKVIPKSLLGVLHN